LLATSKKAVAYKRPTSFRRPREPVRFVFTLSAPLPLPQAYRPIALPLWAGTHCGTEMGWRPWRAAATAPGCPRIDDRPALRHWGDQAGSRQPSAKRAGSAAAPRRHHRPPGPAGSGRRGRMVKMAGPVRVVALNCSSCGATLEIAPDMSQFACGYCGASLAVERRGGTIALKPVVEAVALVQAGTDKTAAELAIARLNRELDAARAEWAICDKRLSQANPQIMVAFLGILCVGGGVAAFIGAGFLISAFTETPRIIGGPLTFFASPQHGVGRGRRGESSMPPEFRKSIAIRASAEWKP